MGLSLFFLPNFPGATCIQGATFIPDSRVVKTLSCMFFWFSCPHLIKQNKSCTNFEQHGFFLVPKNVCLKALLYSNLELNLIKSYIILLNVIHMNENISLLQIVSSHYDLVFLTYKPAYKLSRLLILSSI